MYSVPSASLRKPSNTFHVTRIGTQSPLETHRKSTHLWVSKGIAKVPAAREPVEIETNFRFGPDHGFLWPPGDAREVLEHIRGSELRLTRWIRTGSGWGPDGPTRERGMSMRANHRWVSVRTR